VRIDESLADAHASLGYIYLFSSTIGTALLVGGNALTRGYRSWD
jgi:hypothetical protein